MRTPYGREIGDEMKARLARIRLVVLDVDGGLTDGGIYLTNGGDELKKFNAKDGFGIKAIERHGVKTAIITGKTSAIVAKRAADLEITTVIQGAVGKDSYFREILRKEGIAEGSGESCYVGDDVTDLGCMRIAGFGAAPSDAHPEVLAAADFVSGLAGGRGAVREFCDAILQARGAAGDRAGASL